MSVAAVLRMRHQAKHDPHLKSRNIVKVLPFCIKVCAAKKFSDILATFLP
jgi:hypothetical protein